MLSIEIPLESSLKNSNDCRGIYESGSIVNHFLRKHVYFLLI